MTKTSEQMMSKNDKKKAEILSDIDDAIGVDEMSAQEALDFLEDLLCDIEARRDGLRDDVRSEVSRRRL